MDSSSDEETDSAGESDLTPQEKAGSILLKSQTTKVREKHYWFVECVAGYASEMHCNVFHVYVRPPMSSNNLYTGAGMW